jgi:hypothetical protein
VGWERVEERAPLVTKPLCSFASARCKTSVPRGRTTLDEVPTCALGGIERPTVRATADNGTQLSDLLIRRAVGCRYAHGKPYTSSSKGTAQRRRSEAGHDTPYLIHFLDIRMAPRHQRHQWLTHSSGSVIRSRKPRLVTVPFRARSGPTKAGG